jgi:hypothetical protein
MGDGYRESDDFRSEDYWDDDDSYDFYYPTDCEKCEDGFMKVEFIKLSKDNYCICDKGEDCRQAKSGFKGKKISEVRLNTISPNIIICSVKGCGGKIISKKEPDTPAGPGDWYAMCSKCGEEPYED